MNQSQTPTIISSRYEVQALLGEGGMGRVYKAHDGTLQRTVAIKVLLGQYAVHNVPRFQREAKTMSRLKHSNLIDVYDFGITDDGSAYLVMEYVVGVLLSDVLKKRGSLSIEETIDIAIEIADGMRHAHNKGFVHRDLKPSNIIVKDEKNLAELKIFDFGISKALTEKGDLTQTGAMLGTPLYMSPEQAQAKAVDGQADQYALGCIMYACLKGRPPFLGATALDTIALHINETPTSLSESCPDLNVPPVLDSLILKLLSKNPQDRFASMDDVMETLADVSEKPTEQHIAVVKMRKDRTLKKLAIAFTCLILLPAGVITAFCLIQPTVKEKVKADLPFFKTREEKDPTLSRYYNPAKLHELNEGSYSDRMVEHKDYNAIGAGQWLPKAALASLPKDKVTKLSLSGLSRLEDGCMDEIARFPNLIEFSYSGDQLKGKTLQALNGSQSLEILTLRLPTMGDTDFNGLTDLPNLKHLSLERASVTDACIEPLVAHFPKLEFLDLGFTMVIGSKFGELKKLANLRQLEINNLPRSLTNSNFVKLIGLKSLTTLDIAYNRSLTENGLNTVLLANPKLRVVRMTLCPHLTDPAAMQRINNDFAKRKISLAVEKMESATGHERYSKNAMKFVDMDAMSEMMK